MSERGPTEERVRRLIRAAREGSVGTGLRERAPGNGSVGAAQRERAARNGSARALRTPAPATPSAARPPALYSTHVGEKYAMAISGSVLMLFVLVHMLGNLKLYLGASSLDRYSAWLRNVGEPALPRQTLLWTVRIVLIAAVAVHICAA